MAAWIPLNTMRICRNAVSVAYQRHWCAAEPCARGDESNWDKRAAKEGTFETEDGGGFSAMPAGVDLNSYSKLVKLEKEKQIMETEQTETVY